MQIHSVSIQSYRCILQSIAQSTIVNWYRCDLLTSLRENVPTLFCRRYGFKGLSDVVYDCGDAGVYLNCNKDLELKLFHQCGLENLQTCTEKSNFII